VPQSPVPVRPDFRNASATTALPKLLILPWQDLNLVTLVLKVMDWQPLGPPPSRYFVKFFGVNFLNVHHLNSGELGIKKYWVFLLNLKVGFFVCSWRISCVY
jgi:hypothetical protein